MQNDVFELVLAELQILFGSIEYLESGNGARFKKCAVTVYHENVADGNLAEIAFNVASVASAFGRTSQAVGDAIQDCTDLTGRAVEVHQVHRWPRVGILSLEQVVAVRDRLSTFLL